jgi:outer membrane lipoprotein-sorting protein
MTKKSILASLLPLFVLPALCPPTYAQDAQALVEGAVTYYRGKASMALVDMTIHRTHWERTLTIKGWTRGQKDSIFTIIAPPKDEGNGTLKRGRQMWIYNPKVNRIIKLPPSMMSQAWMGSDFSNNDLAKSDSIIKDYTHTITGTESDGGKKVYIVQSMPKPEAPVVWGMQRLKIRDDHILLREEYYDENFELVKAMSGEQIQMLGGKLFPKVWKMQKAGVQDEYTLLDYKELTFEQDLPGRLFTLSALKNPGR